MKLKEWKIKNVSHSSEESNDSGIIDVGAPSEDDDPPSIVEGPSVDDDPPDVVEASSEEYNDEAVGEDRGPVHT